MKLTLPIIISIITLLSLSCPNKDKYCGACEGTKCILCYNAYLDKKGRCVAPKTFVDNCVEYEKDGVCKYCQLGYYTNNKGECELIMLPFCVEINDEGECTACRNRIKPVEGECDRENKCQIANCQYCAMRGGKEICLLCDDGYATSIEETEYYCKTEQRSSIHNCTYINPVNDDLCAMCDINFYWANGRCLNSTLYTLDLSTPITAAKALTLILTLLSLN